MVKGILRKTGDHESVRGLALEAGLEDGTFEGIVCVYGYYIDDELAGCAALKGSGRVCFLKRRRA